MFTKGDCREERCRNNAVLAIELLLGLFRAGLEHSLNIISYCYCLKYCIANLFWAINRRPPINVIADSLQSTADPAFSHTRALCTRSNFNINLKYCREQAPGEDDKYPLTKSTSQQMAHCKNRNSIPVLETIFYISRSLCAAKHRE